MKKITVISVVAVALILSACASRHKSSILPERGVKAYDREFFLKKESYGISQELKEKFSAGEVTEGMTADMVRYLWGPADRRFDIEGEEEGNENIWEYVTREGYLISSVTFGATMTRSKAIGPERIVTEIKGDRMGGLPPGMSLADIKN